MEWPLYSLTPLWNFAPFDTLRYPSTGSGRGSGCGVPQEKRVKMFEQIDPLIAQIVLFYEIPGLAVGVVKDHDLVYARGFGVKSLASGDPVTPTSLFHLASISKLFVATAIVHLVEKGQVDLQAPVVKYLPYFKLNDERYSSVTVQ